VTISTWKSGGIEYNDTGNWDAGVPSTASDTAVFAATAITEVDINTNEKPGGWVFNPGTTQYNFVISSGAILEFENGGIAINAGSVKIFNFFEINFSSNSTAGEASIDNFLALVFLKNSTAGNATIHTFADKSDVGTVFGDNATAGSAQLITDAGAFVDFSDSAGPDGLGHVTAGSIAGAGTYKLGGDRLTVGLNGLSTEVSGPIEDGGLISVTGASLVKVGHGTLKLSHAGNTYSGGTILEAGTLDAAALRAVGTGDVTFAGAATLKIDNAALSAHHFGNAIDAFARHDVLDLAGLKFHAGATATYHKASHHLSVHSGTITDTLTLMSPHGTHFAVAGDGHGGSDVFLLHA